MIEKRDVFTTRDRLKLDKEIKDIYERIENIDGGAIASHSKLGSVIVGDTLDVDEDGKIDLPFLPWPGNYNATEATRVWRNTNDPAKYLVVPHVTVGHSGTVYVKDKIDTAGYAAIVKAYDDIKSGIIAVEEASATKAGVVRIDNTSSETDCYVKKNTSNRKLVVPKATANTYGVVKLGNSNNKVTLDIEIDKFEDIANGYKHALTSTEYSKIKDYIYGTNANPHNIILNFDNGLIKGLPISYYGTATGSAETLLYGHVLTYMAVESGWDIVNSASSSTTISPKVILLYWRTDENGNFYNG